METKASYVIVGGFVLVLIVGAFFFVLWLTGTGASRAYTTYRTYFTGSVTGLQEGGVVRFRGVPVGTVTRMNIDSDNSEQIEVSMRIDSTTPIKEDTVASLEVTGLTGVAYVQLTGGTQAAPLLRPKGKQKFAVIRSRPSQLEKFITSAPEAVERASELVNRATIALSDENLNAFAQTLDNIRVVTAGLAARTQTIQTTIGESAAAMHELRQTAADLDILARDMKSQTSSTLESIHRLADNANTETTAIAKDFRRTADSVNRLTSELEIIVAENRRPLKDFSGQGLYELTQFLTEARGMVASLTRLANKIEADPARFFFGDQQQGVPVR